MSISVTFNGQSFDIPTYGEQQWGPMVTNYLVALSTGTLQKTGGTFTLSADANFGATYGLVSEYYKSNSSNIASAGELRLSNTDTIQWRNTTNDGNLNLYVVGNDLYYNGNPIGVALVNTLAGLSDVNIPSPTDGQVLTYDSGTLKWISSDPTVAWGDITSTPTTLAGYGITDAQPLDATLTTISGNGTTGTNTSAVVLADAPTFTTNITTPVVTNAGTLSLAASGANIITLNNNGSESARITATGNLLLGTTTDDGANKLQVNGSVRISASSGSISSFISGVAGTFRDLDFQTGATSRWRLRTDSDAESGSNAGSNFRIVSRDDSGAGLNTPFMIYRSTSNVLINTTTDDGVNKLQVSGSAILNASSQVVFTASTSNTAAFVRYVNSGNSAVYTGSTNSGDFDIQTTSTTRLRVTAGGNTLIGTTTDNGVDRVQVSGSASFSSNLSIGGASISNAAIYARSSISSNLSYGVISEVAATLNGAAAHLSFLAQPTLAASVSVGEVIGFYSTDVTLGSGAANATQYGVYIANLSSATNNYGVHINVSSGATKWGIYSAGTAKNYLNGALLIGATTDDGLNKLQVNGTGTFAGNQIGIATAQTPASATATGTTGTVCWDANYVYVCTATNTWKRTAIATW